MTVLILVTDKLGNVSKYVDLVEKHWQKHNRPGIDCLNEVGKEQEQRSHMIHMSSKIKWIIWETNNDQTSVGYNGNRLPWPEGRLDNPAKGIFSMFAFCFAHVQGVPKNVLMEWCWSHGEHLGRMGRYDNPAKGRDCVGDVAEVMVEVAGSLVGIG